MAEHFDKSSNLAPELSYTSESNPGSTDVMLTQTTIVEPVIIGSPATQSEPTKMQGITASLRDIQQERHRKSTSNEENAPESISPVLNQIRSLHNELRASNLKDEAAEEARAVTESLTPEEKINIIIGNIHTENGLFKTPIRSASKKAKQVLRRKPNERELPAHAWDNETFGKITYYKPGLLVISGLDPHAHLEELDYEMPADPFTLAENVGHNVLIAGMDMVEVFDLSKPAEPIVEDEIAEHLLPLTDLKDPALRKAYQTIFVESLRSWYGQQFDWDDLTSSHPSTVSEKFLKRGAPNMLIGASLGMVIAKTAGIGLAAAKAIPLIGKAITVAQSLPDNPMRGIPDTVLKRGYKTLTGKTRQKAMDHAENRVFIAPELKLWNKRKFIAIYPNTTITDFRRALLSLKIREARTLLREQDVKDQGMTMMLVSQYETNGDFNIHDNPYDQKKVVTKGIKEFFTRLEAMAEKNNQPLTKDVQRSMADAALTLFGSMTVWEAPKPTRKLIENSEKNISIPAEQGTGIDHVITVLKEKSPTVASIISEHS